MNDLRRSADLSRLVAPGSLPEPEALDLGALAATLWRGRWLVAAVAALAVILAGAYAYLLATPTFRSTATLVLESRQSQVVDLGSVVGALDIDDLGINTEAEILRGRRLLGQVVDGLDLVADPEFNASLNEPGAVAALKARVKAGLGGLLGRAPEPQPEPSPAMLRERVISALGEAVTVTNLPLTLVFTVSVDTEAPGKSAAVANAIAEGYVADQVAVKQEANEEATAWLAERVAETGARLAQAEQAVKDVQAEAGVTDAAAVAEGSTRLSDLRLRQAEATGAIATAEARVAALEAADTDAARADAAGDASLRDLLGTDGTVPGTLRATFEQRFAGILADARQAVVEARAEAAQAAGALDELQGTIDRQSAALVRVDELGRQAEALRLIYQDLLARLQETSAQQGLQQADARLLSPAVPPERPASPQKARLLAMAGVLGLIGGTALVFLRSWRRRGVGDARALAALTGLPVLGAIPALRGRRPALRQLRDEPTGEFAGAVRDLRTSLLLGRGGAPKVVAVTSAHDAEGRTTLALALTQSLAAMGRRALFLDGDLRRRGGGLVAAIGGAPVEGAVRRDEAIGADVLAGGAPGAVAADAFASEGFGRLLATLRDRYDVVVIDAPPVAAPEARLLARAADLVLFAVERGRTGADDVAAGVARVEGAGAAVAGLVLTRAA